MDGKAPYKRTLRLTTSIGNIIKTQSYSITLHSLPRWHYACTNLGELLKAGLPAVADYDSDDASVHQLLGFGFYSDPDPDRRGFYVDEVSFSTTERILNLTNVRFTSIAKANNANI